jgi:hypothetical protein
MRDGSGRKYQAKQDIVLLFVEFVCGNAILRCQFNSSLEKESGLFPEASDIKSIVKKEFLVSAGSLAKYCCDKDICDSQFEKLKDILERVKQELLAQFDALPESEKLPPVEVNSADQKGSG